MLDPAAKDLIAKLAAAERAESTARAVLRDRSADVANLITEAKSRGIPTDRLAQHLLRHHLGRAPTLAERQREVERLRKRRRRGTTGPAKDGISPKNELRRDTCRVQSSKEGNTMPEHLIRRKTVTTEEEFAVENDEDEQEEEEIACDADKEAAADDDDDDDDEEGEEDEA
ncbi:MAG TPA: hypothetical protein VHO06_26655 [Polyangia bacterium]|nr:hypothetical protein [Polyangia bacterium]